MHEIELCYNLLSTLTAILSSLLAVVVWHRRSAPGAVTFALLMLALTVWSAGSVLNANSDTLAVLLLWDHIEFFGVVMVPPLWLLFTLKYNGWHHQLPVSRIAALFLIPLLTVGFVWTNEYHHLIYRSFTYVHNGTLAGLDVVYGIWFWIHVAYSYALILIGMFCILRMFMRFPYLYKRQAAALLIALIFPFVANVLDLIYLGAFPHLELTPILLTFSGLIITWGLFRFRMLDMVPVARDLIIESMPDGLIVLDAHLRIVDINRAAQEIIQRSSTDAIGQPLPPVWHQRIASHVSLHHDASDTMEMALGEGATMRFYEIRIAPRPGPWRDLSVKLLLIRDITRQRQAERALRNSERQFRETLQQIGLIAIILDKDGTIIFCNDALLQLTGRASDETAGGSGFETFSSPDTRSSFLNTFRQAMDAGSVPEQFEGDLITSWGTRRLISWHCSLLRDPSGAVTGITGIGEDITDHRRMEDALRTSEERLRQVTEAMTEVVWLKTTDQICYVSPSYETIWGRSRKDIDTPPNSYLDGIHPDDREHIIGITRSDAYRLRGDVDTQFRVFHTDGTLHWLHARSVPTKSEDGERHCIVAQDITAIKMAETMLEQQQQLTTALLDTLCLLQKETQGSTDYSAIVARLGCAAGACRAYIGSIVTDAENRRHIELTAEWHEDAISPRQHFPGEDALPRGYHTLSRGEILVGSIGELEHEELESHGLHNTVILPLHANGIWYGILGFDRCTTGDPVEQTSISLLQVAAGALSLAMAEQQRSREIRQQLQQEIEQANRNLEQFVYAASHDLQEPLRMVSSFMQLLAQRYEGQLDDRADTYINFAVDGATRMQELIQALLTYSRIGTRVQPPTQVSLASILATVCAGLHAQIAEMDAVITHDPLPTIFGDEEQLQLLLQHLLDNALKFHGDAPPRIHLSAVQQDTVWKIGVQDNGIGIDSRYTERIFTIFQRLHTRQEYPGTGIGLAVCRRIVERHGGHIGVESDPGQGTTVYVTLPVRGNEVWREKDNTSTKTT